MSGSRDLTRSDPACTIKFQENSSMCRLAWRLIQSTLYHIAVQGNSCKWVFMAFTGRVGKSHGIEPSSLESFSKPIAFRNGSLRRQYLQVAFLHLSGPDPFFLFHASVSQSAPGITRCAFPSRFIGCHLKMDYHLRYFESL